MGKLNDLTGKRFGRLTVAEQAEPKRKPVRWLCRCDCGNQTSPRGADLVGGKTKSCGCAKAERASNLKRKHSLFGTKEYVAWCHMKERCCNPASKNFRHYGGRGITICDRWKDSFTAFLADIGPAPSAKHTVERIRNDGSYEPGNVRWATRQEQATNTRKCRYITVGNETLHVSGWARKLGCHPSVIDHRLRAGWPEQVAVTTPSQKGLRKMQSFATKAVTGAPQ